MTDIPVQGQGGVKVEGVFSPGPASAQTVKFDLGNGQSAVLYVVRTSSAMIATFWGVPDFLASIDEARRIVSGLTVAGPDDIASFLGPNGQKPQ